MTQFSTQDSIRPWRIGLHVTCVNMTGVHSWIFGKLFAETPIWGL